VAINSKNNRNRIRVAVIGHNLTRGGAAIATARIVSALKKNSGSTLNIKVITKYRLPRKLEALAGSIASALQRLGFFGNRVFPDDFSTTNYILHSWNSRGSKSVVKRLQRFRPDVVNIHWVGFETISIEDLSKISVPIVWTFHDLWPVCGGEHYPSDWRFVDGYSNYNRPAWESGRDLNSHVWSRKVEALSAKSITAVCSSEWLADATRQSVIARKWNVEVIPLPIDVSYWKPLMSRKKFAKTLTKETTSILFGAVGGTRDPRKGFKYFLEAMELLARQYPLSKLQKLEVLIFGESGKTQIHSGIEFKFLGKLTPRKLRRIYSRSKLFVAPSTMEAFGQTAAEAQSCGLPVICFEGTGLESVIDDSKTGLTAKYLDVPDLCQKIYETIGNQERLNQMAKLARLRSEATWKPTIVAEKYTSIFRKVYDESLA
jgi:glycosyltransferase involved in cell wall biosynthesis